MKYLFLLLLFFGLNTYAQKSKLIASCCEGKEAESFGRCSGNAYCTACKNCSACKHCGAGGTCGVCTTYTTPKRKTKEVSFFKSPNSYKENDYINVSSKSLNVRSGAGPDYEIVAKLKKGNLLQFLSYEGDWLLVRIPSTGKFGYVHYKYVN